ncbi:MAG: hypothetical protein EOO40_09395, partial [Deltaproteobacteria bacterium]
MPTVGPSGAGPSVQSRQRFARLRQQPLVVGRLLVPDSEQLPRPLAVGGAPPPAPGAAAPPSIPWQGPAKPAGWRICRLPWPSSHAVPGEARADWFERPAYQRELNELTQSSAQSGNCARILVDGPISFAEKERAIRRADVIFLKTYQFDNDSAGRRIASELEEASRRGARVYVQY